MEGKRLCALTEGLSTQELLWFHWLRSRERLRALASMSDNRPPLTKNTKYPLELVRQANARAQSYQLLFARMRRIEGYLEQGQKKHSLPDSAAIKEAYGASCANCQ